MIDGSGRFSMEQLPSVGFNMTLNQKRQVLFLGRYYALKRVFEVIKFLHVAYNFTSASHML